MMSYAVPFIVFGVLYYQMRKRGTSEIGRISRWIIAFGAGVVLSAFMITVIFDYFDLNLHGWYYPTTAAVVIIASVILINVMLKKLVKRRFEKNESTSTPLDSDVVENRS